MHGCVHALPVGSRRVDPDAACCWPGQKWRTTITSGAFRVYHTFLPPDPLIRRLSRLRRTGGPRCKGIALSVLLAGLVSGPPLRAQSVGVNEVFVGSELETYLRLLQVGGQSPLYPWSVRSFSPGEIERILPVDSVHPWARRYPLDPDTTAGLRFAWVRPRAQLIYNSGFPEGSSDGALWAGRGATAALQVGFSARYGPVSLTVAPIAFRAENDAFPLIDNALDGRFAFGDGTRPEAIDLPQRFGGKPYTRLDPGQSTLRIDAGPVAAGIATANQHWGPATEHPILLGNNAAGFLHGFVGTTTPQSTWVGQVHGRVVWGSLSQSDYSVVQGRQSRRFMSGLVGVFVPRGIPGLEVGAARFFHTPWPEKGLTAARFLKPLEGLYKQNLRDTDEGVDEKSDADNQLASVFARWVFPSSGFEVYGEYGREDHSWNLRDFIVEPDHSGGYTVGVQKVWRRSAPEMIVLRGEVINTQISHISKVRDQAPFYVHYAGARQGHTQRGQLLGSSAGYGGGGSVLAVDRYHRRGRWTAEWTRTLRRERVGSTALDGRNNEALDVMHSLGAEAVLFRGGWEIISRVGGSYNFNRNFGSDAANLHVRFGVLRTF